MTISHLSASSINNYLECGLQYRFSRVDRLAPEFTPDNLIYGATIHKVVAEFHQARKEGGVLSLPEMLARFEQYWREAAADQPNILYSDGKDFQTLRQEGLNLLKAYQAGLPEDQFQVLAIRAALPDRLMKKIKKVYEGIARGVFIPNDTSWKCPGCAYKSYCDTWFAEPEG